MREACQNLTSADRDLLLEQATSSTLVVVYLVLCSFSLLTSSVNVAVFTRPRMFKNTLNLLLAGLESANLVLALMHFPLFAFRFSGGKSVNEYVRAAYVVLVNVIWADVLFIIWMTVIIMVWRYLAIWRPLRSRVWLLRTKALTIITVLVVICVLITAIQILGFRYEYRYESRNCSAHLIPDLYQRVWGSYTNDQRLVFGMVYLVLNFLYYLVPVLCFLVIHFLIVRELIRNKRARGSLREGTTPRQVHHAQETRSTVILVFLLFTFLVAYAPPCLLVAVEMSLVEYQKEVPLAWEETFWEFIPGMIINVASFVGYYCMNPMFRTTFKKHILGQIPCLRKMVYSHPGDNSTPHETKSGSVERGRY